WVEDLRPGPARPAVSGAEVERVRALDRMRAGHGRVAALPVPVAPAEDNGGFVHAPSPAQAATAAVLRDGYMTHKGTSQEGLLAIDLSSERVARALWYIAGVRQGQNLGALLGYRFEEGMHAANLDRYVQPFRDRFPIIGAKLTPETRPGESVAATDVV